MESDYDLAAGLEVLARPSTDAGHIAPALSHDAAGEEGNGAGAGAGGAQHKRLPITRITTACDGCRSRKYRCSGELPCSNCVRSKCTCVFTPNKRTKRKSAPSPSRLRHLPIPQHLQDFLPTSNDVLIDRMAYGPRGQPTLSANARPATPVPIPDADGVSDQISSILDFMNRLRPLILSDAEAGSEDNEDTSDDPDEAFVFPGRAQTENLCLAYLEHAWEALPIVHEHRVRDVCEEVTLHFDGRTKGRPFGLSEWTLYCAIMAVGGAVMRLRFPSTDDPSMIISARCARRARQLVLRQAFVTPSLETLQILLLLVQHYQQTLCLSHAWGLFGLAVQQAIALGLHTESKYPAHAADADAEQRRQTWWSCFVLDTELSHALGYESLLRHVHATCLRPSVMSDAPGPPSDDTSARSSTFIRTAALYEIFQRGMSQTLVSSQGGSLLGRLQALISIDVEISAWLTGVPSDVSARPRGSTQGDLYGYQTLLLSARYWNCRLWLFLSSLIDADRYRNSESSFFATVALAASYACLDAAHEVIAIWHQHHSLASISEAVVALYTACTALLAARPVTLRFAGEFDTSWSRAMAWLQQCGFSKISMALSLISERLEGTIELTPAVCRDLEEAVKEQLLSSRRRLDNREIPLDPGLPGPS